MAIVFSQIYSARHDFNDGIVDIDTPFTGNVLSIECSTKPEYANDGTVVGYLYQNNGDARKAYAIKSGKDLIGLALPETTSLRFLPTRNLSDNYTLTIEYTLVGVVTSGANSTSLPDVILDLPVRVDVLEVRRTYLSKNTRAASQSLSALRLVRIDESNGLIYADCTVDNCVYGLTLQAASIGDTPEVVILGTVSDSSWNWSYMLPLYLGAEGQLSYSTPTTGFIVPIGNTVENHSINLSISQGIAL
jgi:hypothetical protein